MEPIISENRLKKIKQVASNRQKDFVVVLEDIYDPHNAAAIIRTCDGLGIQKVYFIFEEVDSYNPKKVGKLSSSSANKWVDFELFKSTKICLNKLKREGYEIYATILDEEAEDLYKIDFLKSKKIAILVGSESVGLSQKAIQLSDRKIYMPMKGMVQSFNVSVTAAIFLSEIIRQRTGKPKKYLLPPKERGKLIKDFMKR
jgi:tRNA (guanosine-2'-O-)-methyltransferase